MPGDLLSSSLIKIACDLSEKRVTARDLIEAVIARHDRFGEHAYSLWAPEQARAVAAAADAAFSAGVAVGPLQGLPVSIKDLFAVTGYHCFAGSSRRLPADPWERDGPLMATLRRQLGVIIGKTHMVEFAFGGTGHNSHWGAPYNPWDATAHRAPGGSSSGAGVSLLEGSALLAFGSDTAGSVRIPACMTGTVGLKVTLGRWPADGVVPLSPTFERRACWRAASQTLRMALPHWIPAASTLAGSSRGQVHATSPAFASASAIRSCGATAIRGSPKPSMRP